jgi:hypothetical protein
MRHTRTPNKPVDEVTINTGIVAAFHEVTFGQLGGRGLVGTVATDFGFVEVQSFPLRTTFAFAWGGRIYSRTFRGGVYSEKALSALARDFAKVAQEVIESVVPEVATAA